MILFQMEKQKIAAIMNALSASGNIAEYQSICTLSAAFHPVLLAMHPSAG